MTATATAARAWELLRTVPDPEVPVVDVVGLGIVRGVEVEGDAVTVTITPTYSGCPAMRAIEDDVARVLGEAFPRVEVHTVLSPAWTTDWMTEEAREALRRFGIAPPHRPSLAADRALLPLSVLGVAASPAGFPEACPQCGSTDVERIAEFGSTSCKAMYRCRACAEPFDYFKAH